MKKIIFILAFLAVGTFLIARPALTEDKPAAGGKSAAELEKEKALANPYPNDFGPEKIDVSKYTPEQQAGYNLLQDKCARCHRPSRPLNSQFLQLKTEEQAAMKASNPEIF